MVCPECNQSLQSINLKAGKYSFFDRFPGIKNILPEIALDYCSDCGGVWAEQGEVNFIHQDQLQPLIAVLPQKIPEIQVNYSLLKCPKDGQLLQFFHRDSIPNKLSLYRCNGCKSIWFPNKSIIDFKDAQETKINYFKVWQLPLTSVYSILLPSLLVMILSGGLLDWQL